MPRFRKIRQNVSFQGYEESSSSETDTISIASNKSDTDTDLISTDPPSDKSILTSYKDSDSEVSETDSEFYRRTIGFTMEFRPQFSGKSDEDGHKHWHLFNIHVRRAIRVADPGAPVTTFRDQKDIFACSLRDTALG